MATKAAPQKTLFIGEARICQQIAYVLDIQDFTCVEKLTRRNWEQYRDYQIYVCDFQRNKRQLLKVGEDVTKQLNLQTWDDICRRIDGTPVTNSQPPETTTTPAPSATPTTAPQPLGSRIVRGIKHPLRATWHLVLRLKWRMHKAVQRHQATVKQRRRSAVAERKRRLALTKERQKQREQQTQIRQGNLTLLQNLKPSELLRYVLQAKPNPKIRCTRLETNLRVGAKGDLKGCCSVMVPFGNLLHDGELNDIYHGTYARIVKLSSLNRSYCCCNLRGWCKGHCAQEKSAPTVQWQTPAIPESISVKFDRSCNLCCQACRSASYVMDDTAREHANTIAAKLLRSGYLDQTQTLIVAGMGEVFYSPYYRQLLTTDLQRQKINLLTNGTLLNETNWRLVAGKYQIINVDVSMDAATAETYQKLRGGNFDDLMHNLTMLGDLHRQKQIRKFGLNFVVQRDNFREMADFVRLGKTLGVNRIEFQHLNNWGTFTTQEYLARCLTVDNCYLDYELWCVLQDPIFRDPMVDLSGFQRYLDASERRYRQCYEKEQKQ